MRETAMMMAMMIARARADRLRRIIYGALTWLVLEYIPSLYNSTDQSASINWRADPFGRKERSQIGSQPVRYKMKFTLNSL